MKCPIPNPGSSPVAHTVAKCDGRIERVSVHSDVLTYVLDEKQQSGPVLGVPVERRARENQGLNAACSHWRGERFIAPWRRQFA